ncbi:aromatic-ring-hydroxylating dioxygenase subunit beta [Altererythrobacter sp. C41]|uniref:aromatic-ring-hydroxylating dioxygenase subunit beta n=1 Tax=Altererythrobacter sp. C41 TaxID=2806021 RepID=UPI001933CE92|nr:aromatic-ring-hydroxylating dioxygenase subunit beta [Altererythrobacter sp. C41]MBM0171254.1 aromatic-ring-hydroxylating dioxygenase subunit beta [Altererythrobacter sp. C41]
MTAPVRDEVGRITRGELRDLFDDYAACLDAEALREFPAFFTEDAKYQVISRENHDDGLEHASIFCLGRAMIEDRVTATVEAALYQPRSLRHFVSGVRITGEENGEVRAEANFLIIESLVEREPRILMVGRYLDRVVREDGSLKFRERTCVFDNYRIRTTLVIPV